MCKRLNYFRYADGLLTPPPGNSNPGKYGSQSPWRGQSDR